MYLFELVLAGYTHRSGITGSYDNSIFRFLRNLNTVLHSGFTILHPHQKCRMIPFLSGSLHHSLYVDFLMMAIMTAMRYYLFIVLITFL